MKTHPMKPGTYTISSGYGPRWGTHHNGLDFAAPVGTPIYAPADGVVVQGRDRAQGSVSGFGSWIWIDCQDSVGRDFIYGHVHHPGVLVARGDRVKAGQQIGVVGNEGQSTGPHLHFEVWRPPGRTGGSHEDPAEWLDGARAADDTTTDTPPKENTVGRPTEQFKADKNIWVGRHNGVRKEPRRAVCLHTDESAYDYAAKRVRDSGWSAERLAGYNNEAGTRGSYHIGVDNAGNVIRQVNDRGGTWSVGNQGNNEAIHICMAGTTAHWTSEQWMTKTTLLLKTAQVVAHTALFHGIPIRRINADQTRAGSWGINGHWDWTKALGGSTHWDPGGYPDTGGGFPWDIFMELVQQEADKIMGANKPEPAPETPTDEPTPQPSPLPTNDELTLDQLVGPEKDDIGRYTFGGWDCLGGRTLVEAAAAIGEKLGVPGCYDPHAQDYEPDDGTPESEAEYIGRRRLDN